MQSYVPMTALLAWWWLGERFGWRTGAGDRDQFRAACWCSASIRIVLDAPMALVLMLISALFLAIGTVLMRRPAAASTCSASRAGRR